MLLLLLSCQDRMTVRESEFRVEVTSVSGTVIRITVAAMNPKAYYCYTVVGENEPLFNASTEDIIAEDLKNMDLNYPYFADVGKNGSYTDIFCYRGSRQFNLVDRAPDSDIKFVLYQFHPQKHTPIGEPVVKVIHTKPVPERNLSFEVSITGEKITVTPSDPSLPYIWDYDNNEYIKDTYYLHKNYLQNLVNMYDEYGFLESEISKGPEEWNFADDTHLKASEEYALVIGGCENGGFTTPVMYTVFRYNKPGDVEILVPLTESTLD